MTWRTAGRVLGTSSQSMGFSMQIRHEAGKRGMRLRGQQQPSDQDARARQRRRPLPAHE